MSPSEGQRVLVTGGSGFTGTYVMAALARAGYEPVDAESSDPDFDLANRDSVRAVVAAVLPDFVIHLAALSFVGHDDAAAFYAVNAVGTTHLLDAIASLQSVPRRVVVASSANVYGNSTVEPITEATPAAPVNHYAASKMAMEAMARTYVDRLPSSSRARSITRVSVRRTISSSPSWSLTSPSADLRSNSAIWMSCVTSQMFAESRKRTCAC